MAHARSGRKRILVTGGAGFIGSHLADHLLALGHEVLCVDNLATGSRRNIEHLHRHPRFEFMRADVRRPLCAEVDEIYSLACPGAASDHVSHPVLTVTTCVQGAINMLDLASRLRCPIVLALSAEVYGEPAADPQREDAWGAVDPVGPRACYAEGKRCAETLAAAYAREHGVRARVARIFPAYGPRMRQDARGVSGLVARALAGEDVTLYGDGGQTRSLCHVDDVVRGLILLMESGAQALAPVNIGDPDGCTMKHLTARIVALSGSPSRIVYLPLPGEDPRRRRPDVSLARSAIGWRPCVGLDEGLASTIAYFRTLQAA